MEIISFTGKSGTGKSYQASRVCIEKNIDAIIDDGLFIHKGKVVAGQSAKKAPTKAAAMRTAMFNYESHCNEVKAAIVRSKPKRLMIIGTSDKMVDYITDALGLHRPDERLYITKPKRLMIIGTSDKMVDYITDALGLHRPDERLYITDFTTEEEREIARHSRYDEGNHVIPAPMGELKIDFSGYFMNPLKFIKDFVSDTAGGKEYVDERDITVVRPQYSYFGRYSISSAAIKDIISIVSENHEHALSVLRSFQHGGENRLVIDIGVLALKDKYIIEECKEFQEEIYKAIEDTTSFNVSGINIMIDDICFERADLNVSRRRYAR
ncbi:MAG: hypothetical protein HUJ78_02030 [Mogibacterium sp.]|nr:hypothetical protein [Mogibacterium sp.]